MTTEDLTEIVVLGSRERLERVAGGAHVLTEQDLADSRVLTINEALRKIPGVFARDEEGLGLRPNIGIRGLNPTRSTKVLLLEDGLPLAFAPYGDNASYFHPSIERFNRIEVLKNSGQIAFGPQTVGGLVNYISADPPESFAGRLAARGGNRGYRDWQVAIGDTIAATETGWRIDATRKQSAGSRENIELDVTDVGVKVRQEMGAEQSLTLRASVYHERSQVPYSGLTLAEFVAGYDHSRNHQRGTRYLLETLEGVPVAGLNTLCFRRGLMGLASVATDPAQRGKGYSALLVRAAKIGRAHV